MATPVLRVGVLTPHSAVVPAAELPAMAPDRVVTCVARVAGDASDTGVGVDASTPSGLRSLAESPLLDQAAWLLGRGALHGVGLASTSFTYANGFDVEAAVIGRLSDQLGIPVVATCASAVLALSVLEVERVALVHPPWFEGELNDLGAEYFRSMGFEVVSSGSAGLSQDPRLIDDAAVYEWTARHVDGHAQAVFIGGNGFRAAAAIAALEATLARPVLTSNQVLLWNLVTQATATFEVSGHGRLFLHRPRSSRSRAHALSGTHR